MASSRSLCRLFLVVMLVHTARSIVPDTELAFNTNPNARNTRGSRFALAFMKNQNRVPTNHQIGLFITTEQDSSTFTLETRFAAGATAAGFTETAPGSGLYSRTEVAVKGNFTFINLPAGRGSAPDFSVLTDGEDSSELIDRQKGVYITAADSSHELTVYVLSDETISTDAFTAISCDYEFPTQRPFEERQDIVDEQGGYQYYVFSSTYTGAAFNSRFLITPCEDNTRIRVRPSLPYSHADYLNPNFQFTDPQSPVQNTASYNQRLNRFDTVMLTTITGDLTGSIVISDKPVSVIVGHQCGTPIFDVGTCDFLVEQVPPHATFGQLFFMAPFAVRESGELYRIGSVSNYAEVTINCNCRTPALRPNTSPNRVALQSSEPGVYTATIDRGEFVECLTPEDTQSYCCIQSNQSVTVMEYTIGFEADQLMNIAPNLLFNPIGDPSMVYVPPVTAYLNSYSLSTAKNLETPFQGYLSYILPTTIFDNSLQDQNRFQVNGATYIPADGYTPISCRVNGSDQVCAYGATRFMGRGNFELRYQDIDTGGFWGFAYGYQREISFAYPLAYELEATGLAWAVDRDRIIPEADITLTLGFHRPRGLISQRSRAFAYTEGGTATAGTDYETAGVRPGTGINSNLRWRPGNRDPNNQMTVRIIRNPEPEPVETIRVQLRCEDRENCYAPRSFYTITIVDPDGACASDLPTSTQYMTTYDRDLDPPFPRRPYGTIATQTCVDNPDIFTTRVCENGVWSGQEPVCVDQVLCAALPGIDNGMISYATDPTAPHDVGTVATYTCNMGYELSASGDPMRTCRMDAGSTDTASFDGTAPTCEPVCQALPALVNGTISYATDMTAPYSVATVATYTCNSGYELSTSGDPMRTCMDDGDGTGGSFRGTAPTCEPLCTMLPAIANGMISYSPDMTAPYSVATVATYTCNAGFVLSQSGDPMRTCEESDDGNSASFGGTAPTCDAVVTVMFGQPSYTFTENGGTGQIQVVTSGPAPFNFSFGVNGGPSTQQFVVRSGGSISATNTFSAGATSFTINVPLTDDSTALEDVESYVASLTLAAGTPARVVLGSQTTTSINVQDDDAYTVGFGGDVSVVENAGPATLNIVSTPAARDVTLSLSTSSSGDATSGTDYTAVSGRTVVISAGGTSASFSVDITDDDIVELDETFSGVINSASGDGLADSSSITIQPMTAVVTIVDEDTATVTFTMPTYSFNEGSGTGSVTVQKMGEVSFPFTISVSGGPSEQTGITINADGIDSTVVFPSDQDSITFDFDITDDNIGLEEIERYIATLTVVNSPVSRITVGPTGSSEIQVMDDDSVSVGFQTTSRVVQERVGQVEVCVQLNRPAAVDVTVSLALEDGSATAGVDYDSSTVPSSLTFSPGDIEECFSVTILDDGTAGEPNENFFIRITAAGPSGVTISRQSTEIIITDTTESCDALPEIPNGAISYDMNAPFVVGTVATYTCNSGYELSTSGDPMRTCMDITGGSGVAFGGSAPTCEPVCEVLADIENGDIVYDMNSPFAVGTVATYSCNMGYELSASGDGNRTCEDSGDGSGASFGGSAPTCEPVCEELPELVNGVISYSPDMDALYNVATVATYTCNSGFELSDSGDPMRTCMDNNDGSGGSFGGTAPTCEPVCQELPNLANGVISYSPDMTAPYSVATVATYTCNSGFELSTSGDPMRTCMDNGDGSGGSFGGTAPTCEPLCPPLTAIANGMITYAPDTIPDYSVGTVATYQCVDGFFLSGDMTRECRSDGTFSGSDPVCTMIPVCADLPALANGVITYDMNESPRPIGTVATHTCNNGYILNGQVTRTCERVGGSGAFSGVAPTCDPVCDELPSIANGMISYSPDMTAPYSVATVATYTCNSGYELSGSGDPMRTCMDNGDGSGGSFGGTAPTCEPVCQELPGITNGMISYAPDMTAPYSVATVATYTCNSGFELSESGDPMRTCMDSGDGSGGSFGGTAPTCESLDCRELPDLVNGDIEYSSDPPFFIGTVATHSCRNGYVLNGTENRTCVENAGAGDSAVFDQRAPVCDPVCDQITNPPPGVMITYPPTIPGEEEFPGGSLAMAECAQGFSPTEPDRPPQPMIELVCVEVQPGGGGEFVPMTGGMQGGVFNITCNPTCEMLPEIANGMISYSTGTDAPFSLGTVATYVCNSGFQLSGGNQMRNCINSTSGGVFDGSAPMCTPIPTDMRECTVSEPMMVSPFNRPTSYTFMGSCERVLLQSCDPSIDFMVRVDFITDTMEIGAVGVFIGNTFYISREDGSTSISNPPPPDVGGGGVVGRNTITVAGGIGVTITHNYGADPATISVVVNSGSSLGETCGLCGTEMGQLRRADGSIADITDREEVEAFTMDYLTPADQQALRPIRRECSMLRNDTIIGDPLYTVALTNTGAGPRDMCYEVRGSANQHYNLISDTCVSVNALYAPMNNPELGNIMQQIGVRIAHLDGQSCLNIRVDRNGCRAFVSSNTMSEMEITSTFSTRGIMVRRYSNRVRISTPNCDEVTLVMWAQCVTRGTQDMLHFVVSRGVNLQPTSHGLLGQFWNIPVTATPIATTQIRSFYTVTVQPSADSTTHRSFLAEAYSRTWDKRRLECLYVGNSQGGPYNELQDPSQPSDSIIQGGYRDYRTDFLHDSVWTYSEFEEERCPAAPPVVTNSPLNPPQ